MPEIRVRERERERKREKSLPQDIWMHVGIEHYTKIQKEMNHKIIIIIYNQVPNILYSLKE